jgi:hypothetical protein
MTKVLVQSKKHQWKYIPVCIVTKEGTLIWKDLHIYSINRRINCSREKCLMLFNTMDGKKIEKPVLLYEV